MSQYEGCVQNPAHVVVLPNTNSITLLRNAWGNVVL